LGVDWLKAFGVAVSRPYNSLALACKCMTQRNQWR